MSDDATLRVDRWLFHARFVKHRDLAAQLVKKRRVRINDWPTGKVHQPVRVGDTITLVRPGEVLVLRILALGTRRGPASEAQALYEVLERG